MLNAAVTFRDGIGVDDLTWFAGLISVVAVIVGAVWAMPGASIQNLGIRADPSDTAKVQIWNPVTSAWVTV